MEMWLLPGSTAATQAGLAISSTQPTQNAVKRSRRLVGVAVPIGSFGLMFCFQMGLQLLGDIVRILDRARARDESMVDGSTSFAPVDNHQRHCRYIRRSSGPDR